MGRYPISSGNLYQKVAFEMRVLGNPDSPADYGVVEEEWEHQFYRRAEFIHRRGGEAIIAARLEGIHTQTIRVRADMLTLAVNSDWRIVDSRTNAEFNVRDIEVTTDRQWVDFLCQRGVVV